MQASAEYHYANGNKIEMFKDSTSIILVFKEPAVFKNDSSYFQDTTIIDMDVSDGTEDTFYAWLTYNALAVIAKKN